MAFQASPHAVKDSHSASVTSLFVLTNLVFVSGLLSSTGSFLFDAVLFTMGLKSVSSKFSRTRRQFNLDFRYSCKEWKIFFFFCTFYYYSYYHTHKENKFALTLNTSFLEVKLWTLKKRSKDTEKTKGCLGWTKRSRTPPANPLYACTGTSGLRPLKSNSPKRPWAVPTTTCLLSNLK